MAAQESVPLGLVVVLALVAAWLLHELAKAKDPKGDVTLGDPTVTGESVISGTDVYLSKRGPSIELDPSNPAIDSQMRELIYQSNNAIAADNTADDEGGQ